MIGVAAQGAKVKYAARPFWQRAGLAAHDRGVIQAFNRYGDAGCCTAAMAVTEAVAEGIGGALTLSQIIKLAIGVVVNTAVRVLAQAAGRRAAVQTEHTEVVTIRVTVIVQ